MCCNPDLSCNINYLAPTANGTNAADHVGCQFWCVCVCVQMGTVAQSWVSIYSELWCTIYIFIRYWLVVQMVVWWRLRFGVVWNRWCMFCVLRVFAFALCVSVCVCANCVLSLTLSWKQVITNPHCLIYIMWYVNSVPGALRLDSYTADTVVVPPVKPLLTSLP